jgi:hypothetical protein
VEHCSWWNIPVQGWGNDILSWRFCFRNVLGFASLWQNTWDNYKEKMFILAHNFGGFNPRLVCSFLWACSKAAYYGRRIVQNHLYHEPGSKRGRRSHSPNDLRTSHKSPPPKYPQHYPIAPNWGPNTWAFGGYWRSKL